jgi:hypothetical protein
MSWQASFPDSVRVQDRWCCDVTVFNGTEKFGVTVFYDRSIDECLPQLRAAVAKRDALTLKPALPIPAGTVVDLTETPATDPVLSKEELAKQQFFTDLGAYRTSERLAALPAELQQRAVDLGLTELV